MDKGQATCLHCWPNSATYRLNTAMAQPPIQAGDLMRLQPKVNKPNRLASTPMALAAYLLKQGWTLKIGGVPWKTK